jgi:hypothetical protein
VPASSSCRSGPHRDRPSRQKAAFRKGTPYMTMRDALGTIFEVEDFAGLFPAHGQPAMTPWRLALVTVSCNSPKGSPIGTQQTRCGRGLTASTLFPWNSRIPASTPRCSVRVPYPAAGAVLRDEARGTQTGSP